LWRLLWEHLQDPLKTPRRDPLEGGGAQQLLRCVVSI
jgi:hypothetical protein